MASLLDLIRFQRDQATKNISKSKSMQSQQNSEGAKRLVNNNVKGFFDALPKPSDLFINQKFSKKQREENNKKNGFKENKIATVSDNRKTIQVEGGRLNPQQRGSINDFINKKSNIASVFKSFGF